MGESQSHLSAFESLLRQVARAPGYDGDAEAETIEPGTVVAGRFEVVDDIGAGGFARVYEARDAVLGRRVALKLLRRRRRLSDREMSLFYREARATARLNHPNIVTAHDWGEWSGTPFLVLELLDGEPLADHIDGPVDERRALEIARDITAAVSYAHDCGVLHLDLKSQNVVVQPGGPIKVLDFGLAGLEWGDEVPGGAARIDGGTPATMAPEQRRREPTDARTDVWAIGVILHELLFGKLPPPSIRETGELPEAAPRRSAAILARTLAPDPDDRFADAAALLAAFDAALAPSRARWLGLGAAAVALAIAAGWAIAGHSGAAAPPPSPPPPSPPPEQRQLTFRGDVFLADLSRDGSKIAYVANNNHELWVQRIDGEPRRRKILTGSELLKPRFTPDGRHVIIADQKRPRASWWVPVDGGEPERLPLVFDFAVGVGDDSIAAGFMVDDRVAIQPLAGGPKTRLALPPARWVFDIDVDPTGRVLAASFDGEGSLVTVSAGAPARELYRGPLLISGARWSDDGGVYYVVDPDGASELRYLAGPDSEPVTVLAGVELGRVLAVSGDGDRLLYLRAQPTRNVERLSRAGRVAPVTRGTSAVTGAAVSADGETIAVTVREGRRFSIRVGPLDAAASRRRIDCAGPCGSPAWSPDGTRLALRRRVDGVWRIAVLDLEDETETILDGTRATHEHLLGVSWLSESEILYMPAFNEGLRVVAIDGGDRSFLREPARGWMFAPVLTADRRRVAFFWNHRGNQALYLADRDGARAVKRIDGPWFPVALSAAGDLVVAEIGGAEVIVSLGVLPAGSDQVETVWSAPPGYAASEAAAIPGSRDVLLIHDEPRSDAWLIENPGP